MFDALTALFGYSKRFVQGFTSRPWHGLTQGKMFEQADGTTDLSRVLGCVAILTYLGIQAWSVIVLKQQFDAGAFGGGLSAVLGGAGVYVLAHNFSNH